MTMYNQFEGNGYNFKGSNTEKIQQGLGLQESKQEITNVVSLLQQNGENPLEPK